MRRVRVAISTLAAGTVIAAVASLVPGGTASALGSPGLYVSTSATRSAASPLTGQTVTGDIYVYWARSVDPADVSGYVRVSFSIDGTSVRDEMVAPFDLGGTAADGSANPLATSTLAPGTHSVKARVRSSGGRWSTYSGTLVVSATSITAPSTTTTTSTTSTTSTTAPSTTTTTVAPLQSGATKVPHFASSSFWYQQLPSNAALDPSSAQYVSNFNRQWQQYYNNVGINTTQYTPPIFVAASSTPLQAVRFWDCQNKGWADPGFVSQMSAVPIPPGAQPSPGTDHEIVISQPSTDTVWEMWQARWASDGVFEACWGGRLDHVSAGIGVFPAPYGTAATGLSLAGGLITPEELQAGHIDHALAVSLVETRQTLYSWPADRTDGWVTSSDSPPEGQRFRLDPSLNIDALGISTTAKIVAHALQTYGMVIRDKAGSVTLYAENIAAEGGTDPYPSLFGGQAGWQVLSGIPWDHLQALAFNYGMP